MPDDHDVLAVLTPLHASWPKPPWTWDGRLEMVSGAVSGADIERGRAVAHNALPHAFDPATLATAPEAVRTIVDQSGGLRGNQLALCDDTAAPRAIGLWWPWGGGGTVSLRIGLLDTSEQATASLRALFGV
jgi:hypothetical protein